MLVGNREAKEAEMTVLVDLKGQELEARGCGNCSGSKSDNKIRVKVEDLPPIEAAPTAQTTTDPEGAESAV